MEITDEMVERAAYPIFVGVARAPWTSREDDEPCPVKPFTKNHARNIARTALLSAFPAERANDQSEKDEAAREAQEDQWRAGMDRWLP